MRFELHINGSVIVSNDFDELKKVTTKSEDEYEIYQIFSSKLYDVPYVEEKQKVVRAQKVSIHKRSAILSFKDAKHASEMFARGFSYLQIGRKFHVGYEKISRSVHHYDEIEGEEEYYSRWKNLQEVK